MKILTLSITRNRGMIGDTETKVPPSNKILRRALPGPQRTISQVQYTSTKYLDLTWKTSAAKGFVDTGGAATRGSTTGKGFEEA